MSDLWDEMDRDLSGDTQGALEAAAKRFGLTKTSGKRSPARNAAVGGAKNSYHVTGQAGDFAGSTEAMKQYHGYVKQAYGDRLEESIYGSGDHKDHVHVAWKGQKKGGDVFAEMDQELGGAKPHADDIFAEMDRELGAVPVNPKAAVQSQIDDLRTNKHMAPTPQPMSGIGGLRQSEAPGALGQGDLRRSESGLGNRRVANNPDALEQAFEAAKQKGDIEGAKRYGAVLTQHGYKVLPGDGGWPYIANKPAITSPGELRASERNLRVDPARAVLQTEQEIKRLRDKQASGTITQEEWNLIPTLEARRKELLITPEQRATTAKREQAKKRGERGYIADALASSGVGGALLANALPEDVTNVAGALGGGVADLVTGAANLAPYGAGPSLGPVASALLRPVREKASDISGQLGEQTAIYGREGLLGDVEKGIAGSAPMLAASALAGPAGPLVAGLMGVGQTTGGIYNEARQAFINQGMTPAQADARANKVSLLGIPIGMTEMWGIGSLPGKAAKGQVHSFIRSILNEAGEEATQEAIQQTLSNLTAKGLYDPSRGVFQDVPYSAVVAGITGGAMGGGFHGASRIGAQPTRAADPNAAIEPDLRTAQSDTQLAPPLEVEPSAVTPVERRVSEQGVPEGGERRGFIAGALDKLSDRISPHNARVRRTAIEERRTAIQERDTDPLMPELQSQRAWKEARPAIDKPDSGREWVYLDLNNFKRVNDEQSHDAGDEVLRQVSAMLPEMSGPDASLMRAGGDEIGIAVPVGQGESLAKTIRENLRVQSGDIEVSAAAAHGKTYAEAEHAGTYAKLKMKLEGDLPIKADLLDKVNKVAGEPLALPSHYVKEGEMYVPKGIARAADSVPAAEGASQQTTSGAGSDTTMVEPQPPVDTPRFKDLAEVNKHTKTLSDREHDNYIKARNADPIYAQLGSKPTLAESTAAKTEFANRYFAGPAKPTEATTASVPLMITRDQRQQLADLGYKAADVDKMRPENAHEILKAGTTPAEITHHAQVQPRDEAGKFDGPPVYPEGHPKAESPLPEAEQEAYDTVQKQAFADPEWARLHSEIADGQADEATVAAFRERSEQLGLPARATEAIIAEPARVSAGVESEESAETATREGTERDQESTTGERPENVDAFARMLVDEWGQSHAVAEATAALAGAFDQTYARLSGEPEGTILGRLRVAAGEVSKGLSQEARAATTFLQDGTAILHALQDPNESTAAHELFHSVIGQFVDLSVRLTGEKAESAEAQQLIKDMDNLSRWMGFKDAAEFKALHDRYISPAGLQGADLRRYVGDKTRGQERGARAFETYIRTGRAPTPFLERVFAQFKEWLSNIYHTVAGSDIDVGMTAEQAAIFDRMLGGTGDRNPKQTGIKNATTTEEREARGDREIEGSLSKSFGESLADGKALVDEDPSFRGKVAEWANNPKALNDSEDAALAYDRMKLYNEHRDALKASVKAIESGVDEDITRTDAHVLAIEELININDVAARKTGTENGRGLNARKLMIRQDYSLANMLQRARVAHGETLTPQARKKIEEMAEKIQGYEADLELARARVAELESQAARTEKTENWSKAIRGKGKRPQAAVAADMERVKAQFAKVAGQVKGLFQRDSKQQDQADTEAFEKWAQGKLLKTEKGPKMRAEYPHSHILERYPEYKDAWWYHGTQRDIDEFKTKGPKRNTSDIISKLGVHLTEDPSVASDFATNEYGYAKSAEGGNVMPLFVRMGNPKSYEFESDLREEMNAFAAKQGVKGADRIAQAFVKHLQSQGHDGILYGNVVEGTFGNRTAIAFDSKQMKSAIGNKGTFDPNNPNILYQADTVRAVPDETSLPPELQQLIKQFARLSVEAGARTAEEVNAQAHGMVSQHFPEVTARETADIWSEYGKAAKLSKDEIDVALREAKRQQRLLAALEDVEGGEAPKRTGLQRDKPSNRVRELNRAVQSEMRKQGIQLARHTDPEQRWATALEGIKTRLRNSITDMTKRLETGEKAPKRTSTPLDAEATALRAQRDELAKTLKIIDGPRRLTDEERVTRGEQALEKSITALDGRIKAGELKAQGRTSSPWSARIAALRAQKKALDEQLKELRKAAKPPKDADAAKLKGFKKRVDKSIKEYERRLAEGDFTTKPRKKLELDEEAQKLAAARDTVKRQYQNELAKQQPGKWWRNVSGLRKSWMLSGPMTQVRNIAGTGAYQVFDEVSRMPAVIADATVARWTHQRSITGPSPVAVLDSVIHGFREGGAKAKQILKQGATAEQMAEHQGFQEIDTGLKALDVASNAVFRFMTATDRVFREQSYRRNLLDRAMAQAETEARTDKELNVKQRAKDLAANPDAELKGAAEHDALVATFNNSNQLSDAIKRARSAFSPAVNFAVDLIMPFDRTPTNVITRVLEATPLGAAKGAYRLARGVISGAMTQEQQRQAAQTFGRGVTGSAVMGLGWYLASLGLLTGGGDEEDRKKGVESNSLKIGDTWYAIGPISPLGNILTLGAGLYTETHRDNGTAGKVLGAALGSSGSLVDQPLLRGATQATDLLRTPDRNASRFLAGQVYSFVPFGGMVRDVGRLTDSEKRKPERAFGLTGVKEQFQANVPGWRNQLPPKGRGFGPQMPKPPSPPKSPSR